MAKLWEVLKAFDEGTALGAFRKTDHGIYKMKKGIAEVEFRDEEGVRYGYQGLSDKDMEADWDIVTLKHQEFRNLFVVIQITDGEEDIFWRSYAKENTSLHDFLETFRSDEDEVVEVMTAIGVSERSKATVIVQEGTYQG